MVVTMVSMRMMEASIHEVVGVISMRNRFMATIRSMHMSRVMPLRAGFATVRIGFVNRQTVLIVMAFVGVVQVAVVQIIDVAFVLDRGVAAAGTVFMIVMLVGMMFFWHIVNLV